MSTIIKIKFFVLVFLLSLVGMVVVSSSIETVNRSNVLTFHIANALEKPLCSNTTKRLNGDIKSGIFDVNQNINNASLRCGNVFTHRSGGIFYKPFETVLENERCVWTIGDPGATGYKVKISFLGENATGRLIIGGFKKYGNPIFFIPTEIGDVEIKAVNILVVTFYSTLGQSGAGFVLQYTSLHTNNQSNFTKISEFSSQNYIGSAPVLYTRPAKYDVGELSTIFYLGNARDSELKSFVWVPKNNIYQEFEIGTLVYTKIKLRNEKRACSNDGLTVYFFNATSTSPGKWERKKRLGQPAVILHNDMILTLYNGCFDSSLSGLQLIYF